MDYALASSGIWGETAVRWAVFLGERRQCNVQVRVEAVGERRWCNGPHGGCGPQCSGTMRRCDGRCCWGRGGSSTDNGGGCSGVFVFYLHMGMGKIHWREEGDPIINRIKDRDLFLRKRKFFSTFFSVRIFT